jgi:hypothetical protein
MYLETGQRTFFYAVSAVSPFTVNIPFQDTSGNVIRCNFVQITATKGDLGSNNYVAVELSGLSRVTSINSIQPATSNAAIQTSGICGFGMPLGSSTISKNEWHGSNGEIATGAVIRCATNSGGNPAVIIGITYGNLIPYNYLREARFDSLGSYDKGR